MTLYEWLKNGCPDVNFQSDPFMEDHKANYCCSIFDRKWLEKCINNGPTDIPIRYRLLICYNKISISSIYTNIIYINFVGLSNRYLGIKNKVDKRGWIYTNTFNYGSVKVPNSIYLKDVSHIYEENYASNGRPGLEMTIDRYDTGKNIIKPIMDSLIRSNEK